MQLLQFEMRHRNVHVSEHFGCNLFNQNNFSTEYKEYIFQEGNQAQILTR